MHARSGSPGVARTVPSALLPNSSIRCRSLTRASDIARVSWWIDCLLLGTTHAPGTLLC